MFPTISLVADAVDAAAAAEFLSQDSLQICGRNRCSCNTSFLRRRRRRSGCISSKKDNLSGSDQLSRIVYKL